MRNDFLNGFRDYARRNDQYQNSGLIPSHASEIDLLCPIKAFRCQVKSVKKLIRQH